MKKQLELNIYKGSHGGRRPNSGRKRIHSKGVAHRRREKVTRHTPFHINLKYKTHIQRPEFLEYFKNALTRAQEFGLNITLYSIQSNHIHMIGEATDNRNLSSGMRSITNSLTKKMNKGSIQIERYHLHVLRNPREVEHAHFYVEHNSEKHSGKKDRIFTGKFLEGKSWLLKIIASS